MCVASTKPLFYSAEQCDRFDGDGALESSQETAAAVTADVAEVDAADDEVTVALLCCCWKCALRLLRRM